VVERDRDEDVSGYVGSGSGCCGVGGVDGVLRNKTFTVADVASRFYASDEYYLYHAGGTPTLWVTALYQKLLNRAPDAAGLSAWVSATTSPGVGSYEVAFEFYQSLESRLKRVDALYQVVVVVVRMRRGGRSGRMWFVRRVTSRWR